MLLYSITRTGKARNHQHPSPGMGHFPLRLPAQPDAPRLQHLLVARGGLEDDEKPREDDQRLQQPHHNHQLRYAHHVQPLPANVHVVADGREVEEQVDRDGPTPEDQEPAPAKTAGAAGLTVRCDVLAGRVVEAHAGQQGDQWAEERAQSGRRHAVGDELVAGHIDADLQY